MDVAILWKFHLKNFTLSKVFKFPGVIFYGKCLYMAASYLTFRSKCYKVVNLMKCGYTV